jgi:hypothetical protein
MFVTDINSDFGPVPFVHTPLPIHISMYYPYALQNTYLEGTGMSKVLYSQSESPDLPG